MHKIKHALRIAISQIKSLILNQITENKLFKNYDLKRQKTIFSNRKQLDAFLKTKNFKG
jgi:hypothetical protein